MKSSGWTNPLGLSALDNMQMNEDLRTSYLATEDTKTLMQMNEDLRMHYLAADYM